MGNVITIPGYCAGHPQHPELLWVFEQISSRELKFLQIEIDFPEVHRGDKNKVNFKFFNVDMSGFDGCPYCEAKLYFFCKRCFHLSCFSWDQVDENQRWTCWGCQKSYRMKVKTTPFQVAVLSPAKQPTTSSKVVVKSSPEQTVLSSTIAWYHPTKERK